MRITRKVGEAPENERTKACREAIETMAARIHATGDSDLAKRIYEAALSTWRPRPGHLAGALRDLASTKVSLDEFLESHGDGCYLRYPNSRDHVLVGCPIEGYFPDDDVAARADVLLAMLPSSWNKDRPPPAFFLAQTYSLDGGSLLRLFENDLDGVLQSQPGTKVIRRILDDTPSQMGECAGAELEVPATLTAFPHQLYFFCRKYSLDYALMVSLLALTKADLEQRRGDFLRWADVPQHVRDHEVEVIGSR